MVHLELEMKCLSYGFEWEALQKEGCYKYCISVQLDGIHWWHSDSPCISECFIGALQGTPLLQIVNTFLFSHFTASWSLSSSESLKMQNSPGFKSSIVDDFMYGSNVAASDVYIRMGKCWPADPPLKVIILFRWNCVPLTTLHRLFEKSLWYFVNSAFVHYYCWSHLLVPGTTSPLSWSEVCISQNEILS